MRHQHTRACAAAMILAVVGWLGVIPAHAEIAVKATHGKSLRGRVDGISFLLLRGSHSERGEAHGALAAREIIGVVDGMAGFIKLSAMATGRKELSWPSAIEKMKKFTFPARFEDELAGMLKGIQSALPKSADRTLISLGREITLDDLKVLQTGEVFELMRCSQFSAWGPLTADGDVIVSRNWDYPPLFPIQYACVLAIEPEEKELSPTLDAMWFGMMGSGLATLTKDGTYLAANDGGISEGGLVVKNPMPAMLVARAAMESARPENAVETFTKSIDQTVVLGLIFHMVVPAAPGPNGPSVVVEYDPRAKGWGTKLRTADTKLPDAVVMTNHCTLNDKRTGGDSFDRYRKIDMALRDYGASGRKIGFDEAHAIMSSVAKGSLAETTFYNVVVWPKQRKMMLSISPRPGVSATGGKYALIKWEEIFGAKATASPQN